jgi:hypothetical protein
LQRRLASPVLTGSDKTIVERDIFVRTNLDDAGLPERKITVAIRIFERVAEAKLADVQLRPALGPCDSIDPSNFGLSTLFRRKGGP